MKTVLGLDLGTNSIGWALVEQDVEAKSGQILGMGSRIIPMDQGTLDTFSGGKPLETQTATRTSYRGVRRLRERTLLRRERLHRVLNVLDFLPEHYAKEIDFNKCFGQFYDEKEPKIAWRKNEETEKFEFLFQKSFAEMVEDFKANGQSIKIPYDWTIYYLRKKALSQRLEKEELAWLILNFNQKRGYYQLRGEEEGEENPNKLVKFHSFKIVDVVADEKPNSKGDIWYSLHLENGWVYRRSSKTPLFDWKDKVRDFIVTTDLNDDGTVKTDKEGTEKRSFRAPSEDDWTLLKKKTEADIDKSQNTVGTYIYETLLKNPSQKIRGKLVRTIERKFYKDELIAILKKQVDLQPELFTDDLYNDCVRELYRSNEVQQLNLSKRDFVHLFINDIIFYQRPLRSQKSSIGNCSLEFRKHKDKDGNEVTEYLKAVPKSNPYYQEFRVWQWLSNLKIYRKDDDSDITSQLIKNDDDKVALFEFLMTKKEVGHKDILTYFFEKEGKKGKAASVEIAKYRWNYVFDDSKEKEEDKSKKYPCNSTGYEIHKRLKEVLNVPANFLTSDIEYKLWHIIYSVTDKNEFEKALRTFSNKYNLDEVSFVENFKKFPPFKSEYGAVSGKAIKKLLPLMRLGKYWKWENIDARTQNRVSKIITGECDETIKSRVREKAINLTENEHFQGLPLWLASYVVYDRHSEADMADKWNSVVDLEKYLDDFKQHSLRNPIVEQVVTETLRVVRDIWKYYGQGNRDFFEEIHVELGREMKNTAEDRKYLSNIVSENENTNLRIKALLIELKNDSEIENVRPHSPMQQDILRIYEEYALQNGEKYVSTDENGKDIFAKEEIPDDIKIISKKPEPTKSELIRYKLWLEQKYRSPYTGQMIPLNRLFTEEYQIEHIIPKSRYFDDSFNNKVICESEVNQLKDKLLAFEFIQEHAGEKVELTFGKSVTVFTEEQYKEFVKEHYTQNNAKRRNLLLDEIPEKMIARQMNDTRYISKFICGLLSNIVRIDDNKSKKIVAEAEILANTEQDNKKAEEIRRKAKSEATDDGINSKNLIPGNGKITTTLKQDWGLNEVWNSLILPRFERMNTLTATENFTSKNQEGHTIPAMPFELQKGFQKKRIDHRHHAMDALVIACATRDHVNLLNNQHAKSEVSRYDLQYKLRNTEKWTDKDGKERDVFKDFKKPWNNFTVDAKQEMEKIVVSFKQNLRVINKATNKYEKVKDGKKIEVKQEGINWAIRKPLHKETVYAKVSLRKIKKVTLKEALKDWKNIVDKVLKDEIKRVAASYGKNGASAETLNKYFKDRKYQLKDVDISKVEIYCFDNNNAAVRKSLDTSFTEKFIKESVTDTGIQKILLNHLSVRENKPELAFSSEGIEEMNKNIAQLNGGKHHQPILKVRVYETIGNKFPVGTTGNKKDKYVEAAKGTNMFFAVYADENGKRSFETIPLNIVIERLKQGLKEVPEKNEKKHKLLFHLSPNDLVYVPTEDEKENLLAIDFGNLDKEQIKRIYKLTDVSGTTANFIQANIAEVLFNMNAEKQKKAFGKQLFPIQNEIGVGSQGSKNPKAIAGEMIKDVCIKLNIDRLGNITKAAGIL